MNSFTTVIYTFKVSKHIMIGQSTNINVFSWLLSFFKLRERESGIQNLGIKENGPRVTYLIFRRGSTGESFFFHGLLDFVLFLILAWRTWVPHVSVILLSSTRSKMAMVRLPATDPAQKTAFLPIYFRWGEGVPTSVLRSQPIIWLLSSPSWCPATWVRSPSTNICLSPLWPTFLLNGHFFDGLILSIQIRGVVILSPSSQWDIAWH